MAKHVFLVQIAQLVEVTLDDEKFTEAFIEEFRGTFYHFMTLDDHAMHIAQLAARGLIADHSSYGVAEFIEGYGPHKEMNLEWKITDTDCEVLEERKK